MHFKTVKGILSPNNNMNLYRGCTHGCIYCDSRSDCYQFDHDFEDIEVKENALELLEDKLRRKRKKCMISTGSMTDPYIPLEKKLKLTQKALKLIEQYGFGVSIITKSNLIERDLDILERINNKTKAVVQITLTTMDPTLNNILEPNVTSTKERIATLKECQKRGIPTVVWLDPILPFINDTEENIRGIMNACIETNVKGIICFGMSVTMRSGNREYFYKKLDAHFPGMKERYITTYHNQYGLTSPNNDVLMKIIKDLCKKNDILINPKDVFTYMSTYPNKTEQLSLF